MGVKQVKIDVSEVTIGMFVSGLDRPWAQTPFPIQGFYVRDMDEIKELKTHCNHLYIDVIKGSPPTKSNLRKMEKLKAAKSTTNRYLEKAAPVPKITIKRDVYKHYEPLEKEVKRARQLHQRVFMAVGEVMSQLKIGQLASVHETKEAASCMVDSIIRNPDAFSWLSRIRETDEYTYGHAVRSAVWAILFGRHIGLAKKELDTLAMGVLLKDVGKTQIRKSVVVNNARTTQEQAEYETFVEKGVDILSKLPGVEPKVIALVKTHREHVNGSGFPNHLKGDKIPLLGRIAGIVTFYDEVINPRGAGDPIAPSRAVARLYEARGGDFQEDLVIEFIRAIGLYPTGTLVELNTGEVGVVVEQNFERRLKPKIMVLLDVYKQPLSKNRLLDLAEEEKRNLALLDSGKRNLSDLEKTEIVHDLEPGTYDVDINEVRDSYLGSTLKKKLLSFFKFK